MKQQDFIHQTRCFEDKLYRLSLRILISNDAAKDAVQEVLLKLWKKRKQLHKIDSLEAYATTLTKNHCYDQLKLKNNRNLRLVHTNFEGEEEGSHFEETEESVKKEYRRVKQLIDDLPKTQRIVMHLRDIENLSFEEIAEILNCTEGSVRVNISRARKTIKKEYLKKYSYEY
ncbi:MAG: RNA polymerase sigma factor [Bacteroidota bacterium]